MKSIIRNILGVMFVFGLMSACSSSGTLTAPQPPVLNESRATQSPFAGKWSGTWSGKVAYGTIQMEFVTSDGDRVTGRTIWTYTTIADSCSHGWEKFEGTKSGESVSVQFDLGTAPK